MRSDPGGPDGTRRPGPSSCAGRNDADGTRRVSPGDGTRPLSPRGDSGRGGRAPLAVRAKRYPCQVRARPAGPPVDGSRHDHTTADPGKHLRVRGPRPHHGGPVLVAHRRRPQVRPRRRLAARGRRHERALHALELLLAHLPRPRDRPRARRGHPGPRHGRRAHPRRLRARRRARPRVRLRRGRRRLRAAPQHRRHRHGRLGRHALRRARRVTRRRQDAREPHQRHRRRHHRRLLHPVRLAPRRARRPRVAHGAARPRAGQHRLRACCRPRSSACRDPRAPRPRA